VKYGISDYSKLSQPGPKKGAAGFYYIFITKIVYKTRFSHIMLTSCDDFGILLAWVCPASSIIHSCTFDYRLLYTADEVPLFTYMQMTTEANMIGKVMSMFLSVGTGLTPFSFVLISYLLHLHIDIQLIIRIFGAFLISNIRNLTYQD